MGRYEKLLFTLLTGKSDDNINFRQVCNLLIRLGFSTRTKGSHHIFFMNEIEEIINIQATGNKAKAYQIKQIRNIILKYKLNIKDGL
ncbi:MAG TPA: type II toxin-antitoxin system HicA family toxin [Bacteroidetes bacterium]|nr:type II toxin-antitoxin system HicA family toxin [Bacteroidota bacterium]